MPSTFAVIDAGSNAMRLEIASVDRSGIYHIVEQERRAVRLGHGVFETGALDQDSRLQALETLRKFKSIADRNKVTAIRAVATSAMREASDGPSFIREAGELGIKLEILSEEEEARLIGLGILSGLKFDPPLGLFMDIGGGSAELAVGNRSSMFAVFSLPLGAVRLTERFLKHDPPTNKELADLNKFASLKLGTAVRRLKHEKFTMAFGSGGTVTALADMDARLTGDARQDSLYVLRRGRLQSLFDLLRSQHLQERKTAILGDQSRADILVGGAAALLAMMTELELDYLFVSRRGLRDGLMVDLLKNHYPTYAGAWSEEEGRSESLEEVGEKYNYDKTHSQQVSRLALSLFGQLRDLHQLHERYTGLLHASAMLHDIGLFIAYEKHHKHSYYLIKSAGPGSFDPAELDVIANVARYHRKGHPSPKHLPFGQLSAVQQDVVRKLAAILRVADALDYGHQSKIRDVKCKVSNPKKTLTIKLEGSGDLEDEIQYAREKSGLLSEVYGFETVIE
jgi:exopolyphosphatase/guanosine-5'-triphosphate,3'-diphosphate pyrophosphatase